MNIETVAQKPILLRSVDAEESYVFIDEADLLPTVKIDLSRLTASDVKTIQGVLEKQQLFEKRIR